MTNRSLLKQQHVFLLSHQDSAAAKATGRFALGGGLPALNCVRRTTNLRAVFLHFCWKVHIDTAWWQPSEFQSYDCCNQAGYSKWGSGQHLFSNMKKSTRKLSQICFLFGYKWFQTYCDTQEDFGWKVRGRDWTHGLQSDQVLNQHFCI